MIVELTMCGNLRPEALCTYRHKDFWRQSEMEMKGKGYQSVSTTSGTGTTSLYESLPSNAKAYYRHPISDTSISNLIHIIGVGMK
jgi:hypothetical protein